MRLPILSQLCLRYAQRFVLFGFSPFECLPPCRFELGFTWFALT